MNSDEFEKSVNHNLISHLRSVSGDSNVIVCLLRYSNENFPSKFYNMDLLEYNVMIANTAASIKKEGLNVKFVDFDSVLYAKWRKKEKIIDSSKARSVFAAFLGERADQ